MKTIDDASKEALSGNHVLRLCEFYAQPQRQLTQLVIYFLVVTMYQFTRFLSGLGDHSGFIFGGTGKIRSIRLRVWQ